MTFLQIFPRITNHSSTFLKSFFFSFIFVLFCIVNTFAISIPEEKEVGEKFMKMIKKEQIILKDPIANHMVNQVGQHILSSLPPQPFDYAFYIVDDDVFNAFASPAANIFVYRGLITSLDSVDELAGIIGHEIAHAQSRHVSESIDRSKYIRIGSLAGILAGAIIGGSSTSEAGVTIATGSLALGTTAILAFTRENETEADEKGIMFLKNSCFAPEGLLSGLMKIRASDFRGTENIPDYVKTHPGTASRIAHAESILSEYTPPENKPVCHQDYNFSMVKYRLLGLYAEIDTTYHLISTQLKENPDDPALHYGMSLVCDRKRMNEPALDHLKKALSIRVSDPMILLEMGRVYLENNAPKKALKSLSGLTSDPVMGLMARYYQGIAYLELRKLPDAKKNFSNIIEADPTRHIKTYYFLANIASLENKAGLSHYYLGVYYSERNQKKTAIVHLRKALESLTDPSSRKEAEKLLNALNKKSNPWNSIKN